MSFFSFLFRKKFPSSDARTEVFEGPLTVSRAFFYILFAGLLTLIYLLLITLNNSFLISIPARGGTLTEGVIGAPRFLNPILAATDTDRALTSLIFAGLMKEEGDGTLVPALAASYDISPDGRMYTFILKEGLSFHDGSALTSSDVAFTIEKLQSDTLNPQDAAFWKSVHIETPDERTVIATLPAPDHGFLQKMTVGIISFANWQGVIDEAFIDPSLNLHPIGAGAFKVVDVGTDESGVVKKLTLDAYSRYALGKPLLSQLVVSVFANQQTLLSAIKNGDIDLTFDLLPQTLIPGSLSENLTTVTIPTQEHVILARLERSGKLENVALLALLNRYIDKDEIVATVENGYGISQEINDPTENNISSDLSLEDAQTALSTLGYTIKEGVLTKAGTPVALGIATLSDPRLIAAGRSLSEQLAALGVITDVQAFNLGTFRDELGALSFPLVLTDGSVQPPSSYLPIIDLYTKSVIASFDDRVHGITQPLLLSPLLRYSNVLLWHTRSDRVYPFLTQSKT